MQSLPDFIASVRDSIVAIATVVPAPLDQFTIRMVGTGFVATGGHIVSCHHVYAGVPELERAHLSAFAANGRDNHSALPLTYLRSDTNHDLAVFITPAPPPWYTPPALALGDSDTPRDGQEATFIGFPQAGELLKMNLGMTLATTRCILSAVKRDGATGHTSF